MYEIGLEVDKRKHGQHRLVKEGIFFYIPARIAVRIKAFKIFEIVDEIICDVLIYILHDADIFLADKGSHAEVEVGDIFKIIPILRRYAGIIRKNDPYVPFLLVKLLRQSAYNIRQSSGLYERNSLACGK